jgi:hypothetical protein
MTIKETAEFEQELKKTLKELSDINTLWTKPLSSPSPTGAA